MHENTRFRAIRLDLAPVSKPRMTYADKKIHGRRARKCVRKYANYCHDLRWLLEKNSSVFKMLNQGVLRIRFQLPMPESWNKAKRDKFNGTPHLVRPDVDNLVKGFLDALLPEDSGIYHVDAIKIWGERGDIILFL